jgi:hypothetical protein
LRGAGAKPHLGAADADDLALGADPDRGKAAAIDDRPRVADGLVLDVQPGDFPPWQADILLLDLDEVRQAGVAGLGASGDPAAAAKPRPRKTTVIQSATPLILSLS